MKNCLFTDSKIFANCVRVGIAAFLSCVVFLSNVFTPGLAQGPPNNAPPGNSGNQPPHPCDRLPDLQGNANGHDKHCPPEGSSAGVALGDFNGDGFADLSVGVPFENIGNVEDAGAVNVIYGSTNGLTEGGGATGVPVPQFWHQNVDGVGGTAEDFDHFGSALAAADFNGDGFSDLAIGVPDENVGSEANRGVVQVLFGSANGLTADDDQFIDPVATGVPLLDRDDLRFGSSLAWGNFNGDRNASGRLLGDLAVGMPGASQDNEGGCTPPLACAVTRSAGGVVIYSGSGGGLIFSQQVLQAANAPPGGANFVMVGNTAEENDAFGSVLSAGDFDNDEFDDLVIGVPKEDVGAVSNAGFIHIAFGSAGGISNRHSVFSQASNANAGGISIPNDPASGNKFGQALAVGDFDGDDRDDLAVGAPFEDVGSDGGAGVVYVLYGINISGVIQPATAQMWNQDTGLLDGTADTDNFGRALAAGDFDADGHDDLAIGVPGEDVTNSSGAVQQSAGAVHVIYGTDEGLDEAGDQFFTQGNLGAGRVVEAGDQFGSSLTAWNFGRNERIIFGGFPITLRTADLAIGSPGEDLFNAQGVNVADVGAVNVLYGNSINRLSATGNQLWHQSVTGVVTSNSDEAGDQMEANDRFGSALY